jgi:hypothetical protein
MMRSIRGAVVANRKVTAYCARQDVELQLRRCLEPHLVFGSTDSWAEFQAALPHAECGIAMLPRIDALAVGRLREIAFALPDTPLILVASSTSDDFHASGLGEAHVVWLDELTVTLPDVVVLACEQHYLRRIALNVERAEQLPVRLRTAIAAACRHPNLFRSVRNLAGSSGQTRSSFARTWHSSAPKGLTPKVLLDWLLLLRAVALKFPSRSWEAVAEALGVDQDTLAHLAHRLMNAKLSDLDANALTFLHRRFGDAVLEPLQIRRPTG